MTTFTGSGTRARFCVALSVLALSTACVVVRQEEAPTGRSTLVGTWRVARYSVRNPPDAPESFPFGVQPRGYLVYDAGGHMFFQIVRPDVLDSLRAARRDGERRDIPISLTDAYVASFGTYEVDESTQRVTHRLEAELPPSRSATEVATPFRVRGDTLWLGDPRREWLLVRARKRP